MLYLIYSTEQLILVQQELIYVMKKIIALILVLSMSFCFAACGNKVQELPAVDPDAG